MIASKSVFYFSTVTDATKIRADLRIITGYADKLLSGHSSSALSFGHLHIIIADRQTRSAKKRKEAQEKFSESLFGTGIKDQNLLETAKKIISAFESIRVWNLPNLGTSLTDDNNDYQDPTSSNYEETVQAIKSVLLDQLTTPRVILDQKLTGTNFAAMIGSVVETVNAGDPIRMESIEEILEPTSVKLERLRTRFIEMDKTEMVGFFKEQLNTVEEDVISATKAEAARQRFCSAIESKIPFLKTDSRENECNDFKVDSARRW